MSGEIDWLAATLALAIGAAIGVVVMMMSRARTLAVSTRWSAQEDEERFQALLAQLREPDLPDDERSAIELQSARLLKEIEDRPMMDTPDAATSAETAGAQPVKTPTPATSSAMALRGFLWGVGSMAIIGGLVIYVMKSSEPRPAAQTAPMEAPMQAAPQAAPSAEMIALQQAVQKNPQDIDSRLELARLALVSEDMMEAYRQTESILALSPNHPQAMTYQAFVLMAMGRFEKAEPMLLSATKADPALLDAWVQLGLLYTQTGKPEEAKRAIDEAIRIRPDHAEALRTMFAQMQQEASSAGTPDASTSPAPAAASSPSPAAGGPGIAGTLEIEGGARSGSVVFITARAAGVTSGPPLAAVRLDFTTSPMPFQLTQANSMMGQPLPATLRIEARLDTDGNAMTREAGAPSVVKDDVALGASALRLTLRP